MHVDQGKVVDNLVYELGGLVSLQLVKYLIALIESVAEAAVKLFYSFSSHKFLNYPV